MKNTKPNISPDPINDQQETELNLPDINKQLVLKSFEGIIAYKPEYAELIHEYASNADDTTFRRLQHELVDLYPAILNVQIRDLFTLQGKSMGRYRLRQLGEVYRTLAHLLSAIALSNLWDVITDKIKYPHFQISSEQLNIIQQYLQSTSRLDRKIDHFQLLRTICSTFSDNNVDFYVAELLLFNQQINKSTPTYLAYQFFENDFCPQFHKGFIPDEEVSLLCQKVEQELGQLLQATAFLSNYEIIRVKDVTVNHPHRRGKPSFIHEKTLISGREYPTVDQTPIASDFTSNNHAIFLSSSIKEERFSLNLSPFIIDQNAFKGKKHYLPKIYFFSGINIEKQLHFTHVDTPSLDFVIDDENTIDKFAFLKQISNSILAFCQDLNL